MAKEQKEKSTFDLYEAWKKRKGKKMNKGSDEMITPKVKIITKSRSKNRQCIFVFPFFFLIKKAMWRNIVKGFVERSPGYRMVYKTCRFNQALIKI